MNFRGPFDVLVNIINAIKAILDSDGNLIAVIRRQAETIRALESSLPAQHPDVDAAQDNAKTAQQVDYQLKRFDGAGTVYLKKSDPDAGDSNVYYCTHCVDQGEPSKLQFECRELGLDTHRCPKCKLAVKLPHGRKMEAIVVPAQRTRSP